MHFPSSLILRIKKAETSVLVWDLFTDSGFFSISSNEDIGMFGNSWIYVDW